VVRVAYLINQYPKVSHSFIRREILAIERQGMEVVRIALRGWDGELVDKEDLLERGRTRYVLRHGPLPLMLALARMALTRPVRVLQALALAWRMSRCSERRLPVHLIYLVEACQIEFWLRAEGVQHLHAHFGTNSAEVAMLVQVLGGPRWSFTVHGPEEFDKGHLIGLREKLRQCAFVVAISSYCRSQLYRWMPHPQWSKVHVVHCGLETAYFARANAAVPAERRLVCVGRLCEQKGQLLLVEAARILVARQHDFELILVGDGELRTEIEDSIARYRLQSHVRITGWISGDAVREEVLSARALVLPSFAEGLPVVIMEAMALRRPIISTFVAGIPELVLPGEHGWLVPAGDVQALTEAMQFCLSAPTEVLGQMGQAAHTRAATRHNVDSQTARLVRLFSGCGMRS